MSPPLHQQRPLEDKKIPSPNGGSPPAHLQNMKPRPESSPSLAVLSNHHHGVGGLTQAPPHGGGYPVYQNSGGHQPPLQVNMSECEYKQMPSVPIIFICRTEYSIMIFRNATKVRWVSRAIKSAQNANWRIRVDSTMR